jgi:hypothetical protein
MVNRDDWSNTFSVKLGNILSQLLGGSRLDDRKAAGTIGIHAYQATTPARPGHQIVAGIKYVYIWRPAGALPKGLAVDRIIVGRSVTKRSNNSKRSISLMRWEDSIERQRP